MQAFIEFLPLVVFFAVYKMYDIFYATGALMAASVLHIAFTYYQTKEVPKKQWVFFAMVMVFGGLTVFLRDDTFIMWKPTIIYIIFAAVLFGSQWRNKPVLKAMLGEAMTLPDAIWNKVNSLWGGFFLVSAAINLYVAYQFSQETWVTFKVFGMTAASLVLTVATVAYLYQYLPKEDKEQNQ